jgi:hypothetical protein
MFESCHSTECFKIVPRANNNHSVLLDKARVNNKKVISKVKKNLAGLQPVRLQPVQLQPMPVEQPTSGPQQLQQESTGFVKQRRG